MSERDHLEEYFQLCRRIYERRVLEGTWPWDVDSTDFKDVLDSDSKENDEV